MESTAPTTTAPATALRNVRIIYGAILMGIFVFAAVAPFVRGNIVASLGISRSVASLLVYSWIAVTIGLSVAGYVLAHSIARARPNTGATTGDPPVTLQMVVSKLILAGVLTEAAAVYGIVVYIIVGYLPILATALAAGILGLALCFPRSDLFVAPTPDQSDAVTFR